jgi:hypothetical protein
MATARPETQAQPATQDASASDGARRWQPYRRSWLDWLVEWMEALPGPTWLAYGALTVAMVVLSNSQNWISGILPFPQATWQQSFWAVMTVFALWFWGHVNRVAGSALDAFQPALSAGRADLARVRLELTALPAWQGWVLLALGIPLTFAYYAADPVSSQVVGLSAPALVVRGLFEGLFTAFTMALVLQSLRQLRTVRRLHALADRIDLFQPAPLHAFSQVSARAGIYLVVFMGLGYLANPADLSKGSTLALWAPFIVGFPLAGIAVFLLPLLNMHDRLVDAKAELSSACTERLKAILAEINLDVDARDLTRADGLQKTLANVTAQRDIIAKLSTWPWSAGTLRALVTAILLPLGLYILQRLLAQVV